ncbi:hypothetical protein HQQ80_09070 [Microbacteriaceae bacterium VKM Ac-2855]|nr:hypothetical protein [Microbacteriaceae bacterium VKM Ac-2855]
MQTSEITNASTPGPTPSEPDLPTPSEPTIPTPSEPTTPNPTEPNPLGASADAAALDDEIQSIRAVGER